LVAEVVEKVEDQIQLQADQLTAQTAHQVHQRSVQVEVEVLK
jgi:hypothetical protein